MNLIHAAALVTDTPAIVTRRLTKSYGQVEALRGLDLEVQRGEIFGFLGPNGAGKTTTIRCLLDLIRPDGGTASVLGMDPQTHPVAVRERVGYLPGELHLEDNLTGRRVLRYFSALRGRPVAWDVANALAERLRLDLDRPVKNLSKGNKQKVGLVQALMHRPELLLLDEPTSGLDPLMQQEVLVLLREAKAGGATVFFCSHIMSEVEAVAERVGIIRQGRLVEVADTAALIDRAVHHAKVRFRVPVEDHVLNGVPGVTVLARDDPQSVTVQVEGEIDGLIKALAALPVTHLETSRPSLEDVFLAYYQADDAPTEDD